MHSFCHRVCQLLVTVQFDFRTFRPFFFLFASLERISPSAASGSQHPSLLLYSIHLLPCSKNGQYLNGCFAPKQAIRTVHSSFTQTVIISTAYLSERRLELLSQLSCRQILAWSLQRMSKAGYDLASICGNYGPWLPDFHR